MKVFEIIWKMYDFWYTQGCARLLPYDYPMGAATYHPACFFGALGKLPISYVYAQASRRKADGRYGISPNRLFSHYQLQVLIKPVPKNIKDLLAKSLNYIGINLEKHDFKLIPNDWCSAAIGASGVGYEVWLDNMEVCQFTYFQKLGDIELDVISVELAYGVERLALFCNNANSIFETTWDQNTSYKTLFQTRESQFSTFYLKKGVVECDFNEIAIHCDSLLNDNLYLPAYEELLRLNDLFNSQDALGLIDEANRKGFIDRMRKLANSIAKSAIANLN